jgi:cysteine desulfurase
MDSIYLDHNSTTPLLPAVQEAMRPWMTLEFGNPASAHAFGRRARRGLEDAREQVASLLDAHPDEVLFTSGATESNNLAQFGLAGSPPGHLIASPLEHPSVTEPLAQLVAAGFSLDLLAVSSTGSVLADNLPALLRPDTRFLAVMLANHETGALQPVQALTRQLSGQPLHCDAVQAVGRMPVSFRNLGAATLSLSAHKFHGPCGIGALLVRRGIRLTPRTYGGHQQRGLRPGTEPVALAVGLAVALEHAVRNLASRRAHILALRTHFLDALRQHAAPIVLNGPAEVYGDHDPGLPHTLNLSFPGLPADLLLMSLDLAGVACSAGSACSSGSLQPSPVLRAMQVPEENLRSALRFSLGPFLTLEQVAEAARRISHTVNRLRRGSAASTPSSE